MNNFTSKCFLHTKERAKQRYNFDLTPQEYQEITAKIAFKEISPVEDCVRLWDFNNRSRELWAVWFKGEWIPLVYDQLGSLIITFLPKHSLRNHAYKLPW